MASRAKSGVSGQGGLIGQPIRRKEDHRLLTGGGHYSDDVNVPGQAYAYMVRSIHAHARLVIIDTSAASAMPGVLAVLTGKDFAADGLQPIPHLARLPVSPPDILLKNRDGSDFPVFPHLPLPADKARYVGEALVVVVAETLAEARDAAELVSIEYEPLSAAIVSIDAMAAEAALVWEQARSNLCVDADAGDPTATDAAFAAADHVVQLHSWVQRVTGVPIEPRAAIGSYDSHSKRYTLYAGSSGVVRHKLELAAVLGVSPDAVRVVAHDVGGNFGTRNALYPEFALVVWAAKRLGRPVKWTCERQEAFLSDYQGRDLMIDAALALNSRGKFLGLRASLISNLGAHTASYIQIFKATSLVTGVYKIPTAHVHARAVTSNSPPTHPYRSTGRPEAMFLIERLIDLAASEHGFDPVVLRRKNLIGTKDLPYRTPLGLTYDSGAYADVMKAALTLIDHSNFPKRRREAARRGCCLGLGISNYIEITTGNPREYTKISVLAIGQVEVVIGTMSSGQGHETSFAQVVADTLGVPFNSITLITGDTDVLPTGGGSHSGRSMRFAGIVIGKASNDLIAKAKRIAAWMFEANEADIEFDKGDFLVLGTNRRANLFAIAAAALNPDAPIEIAGALTAACDDTILTAGFPYGCHACEIEIDPETGASIIKRYAAVDDVGRAINPLILHGQTHGGATQGIGQALRESCHYDRHSGELLSASLMDYGVPRASHVPSFLTELSEVPAANNPLGVRAGGEGGVTPALAAVTNAVVDALKPYGIRHIEMPATPQRVWEAIAQSRQQRERSAHSEALSSTEDGGNA